MTKQPRTTKRLNLSLPPALYDDIIYVSSVLGVSASSIIYQTVHESFRHMADILHQLEAEPTQEAAKRLRGVSMDQLARRYDDVVAELTSEARHDH